MADTDYLAASDGTGDAALMHVTSPRVALATIIQVDTVVGVPAFFIGTWGTLLASGFIDPTTKRDFFGHVNAGTLVIDKMAPGNTDGGNTTGQVVVIKPSTPVQNLVGNFVKTALNNFGEGEMLNGQIVPSISSNNLVVAVKTLNNVDPSASDVVYVRIGGVVRTITAALSVTLAAGTNWFTRGSAPWATVANDYFAYLGYNTTDGVVLGVSSTMNGYRYSDFSVTTTDPTYAKISNIAHAAATDRYNIVARFNAILGVTATFLWTLPAAASQVITNQLIGTPSVLAGQGVWWQELARVTLGAAGNALNTPTFVGKKYLRIILSIQGTGGTISVNIQFNGDTGNNYAYVITGTNNAADAATVSTNGFLITGAANYHNITATLEGNNLAAIEKLFGTRRVSDPTAGAANAPSHNEYAGKWANTAAQITSVQIGNSGAGNFAIGSELIILGHD